MSRPIATRWTSQEESQLRDMLDAGKTAAEIAAELKRSRQAIYAKLQRFYIKKPPVFDEMKLKKP